MSGRGQVALTSPWLHVRPHHGEGVVWDQRHDALLFVDVTPGRVWEFRPATGALSSFDLPGTVGAVHPVADDRSLVVADGEGIALVRDGRVAERLAAPLAGQPDRRMNDANVDPAGRYLAGSMALDQRPGGGALFSLGGDGALRTVIADAAISNGLDWSPDGRRCYYVDSPTRRVDVFDYDVADGSLTGRRCFADVSDVPGIPDGLTVDADGGVWVAFFGGSRVVRFTPDGVPELTVDLPVALVTSCCFGGPDLGDLFISTSTEGMDAAEVAAQPGAGGVFHLRPGQHGRPATPFRPAA
ncbi:SMP-30/gluconolactonase/LRE family protein [Modestobacter sp. L9-4]|uniref:SMP-30/gluconolactonase/LRE family protein n=1 Tax=Modestobacter sp. L9-4 TaxID=2851567 RepID=UPI001C74F043|nr:SMP-30/gluconolactonase/LRE family protein [Modestobacter sp. L9-4]QXG75584.1 SMP-30/gluconolactonase/LRE family protein [Modestobacter sp. L9-4]